MPFAFILIGLILIVASVRGTLSDLGSLLKGDFTGQNNFFVWMVAIGLVGSIGYFQTTRKFSHAFLALILIAMLISNGGFLRRLVEAVQAIQAGDTGNETAAGNLAAAGSAPETQKVQKAIQAMQDQGASPAQIDNAGRVIGGIVNNPIGAVREVVSKVPIIGGLFS